MSTLTTSPRRRHIWRWVLIAILTPWLLLALLAWSWLTPSRTVASLRDGMQAATAGDWQTRMQFDVGRGTLAVVRTGLLFVRNNDIALARQALSAVKHASVGVYHTQGTPDRSSPTLLTEAARQMQQRGWSQFLRVVDGDDTVLGFVPAEGKAGRFCIAVLSDQEMVVISCEVTADELAELVHVATAGKLPPRPAT